jgi:hypothetical protein
MLVIEKVVKLLDDFHYDIFIDYVRNHSKRSFYPEVLAVAIKRELEIEQDSDVLCELVYEANDEKTKKKFFQLAHHTFKLTSFLAKNYPNYLRHNVSRIQHFINIGELKKANQLIDMVLEIGGKVEDYQTELEILQISVQQNVLLEAHEKVLRLQIRIQELTDYQQVLNGLIFYNYKHLDPKKKATKEDVKHAKYFQQFLEHPSTAIQLISTYYYCNAFHFLRDEQFYSEEMLNTITKLENDLSKYDYIILPFMTDYLHRTKFLKLNYLVHQQEPIIAFRESTPMLESSEETLFWNSFINLNEMYALSIQSSYYSSLYLKNYREDFYESIPEDVKANLNDLKKRCLRILNNPLLEEQFTIRYINLTTVYALVLLCGDENDLKEAVEKLEYLLLGYQQVAFHAYIDPIYSILIIAHVCLKNYDKVDEHYKRYRRSTKGKIVNPDNDLALHGFYYAAKWAETNRKQYAKKLDSVLETAEERKSVSTIATLLDIVEYFEIPVTFVKN